MFLRVTTNVGRYMHMYKLYIFEFKNSALNTLELLHMYRSKLSLIFNFCSISVLSLIKACEENRKF